MRRSFCAYVAALLVALSIAGGRAFGQESVEPMWVDGGADVDGFGDRAVTGGFWNSLQDVPPPKAEGHCPRFAGNPARVYADAEYLMLFRNLLSRQPSIVPAPYFDGDFNGGYLLTAGVAFSPLYRIEGTYFGDHEWYDFSLLPNDDPIEFRSRLDNAELVLRHLLPTPCPKFEASFLVGGRYMRIEDTIIYNLLDTTAKNELLAVQGGILTQYLADERTWVDWEIKGAIASNDVSVIGLHEKNVTSIIGETSVVLNYQVLPSVTFRLGYRGIWVTGLALAVEHVEGPAEIKDSGEIVYHGVNVGLVWSR